MNAANPQAKAIFGQALAIDAPAEGAAYLEQACAGDAALRADVESSAMSWLEGLSAAAARKTMRQRKTRAWGVERARRRASTSQ